MNENVLILAQGLGTRWQKDSAIVLPSECKQLVPLGDETIIERTIRQTCRHRSMFNIDVVGVLIEDIMADPIPN